MKINKKLFGEIAGYIVKRVQTESTLSGFQLIVAYSDIEDNFNIEMNTSNKESITDALNEREEVADVQDDPLGFDVVLLTIYAPNYKEEDLLGDS